MILYLVGVFFKPIIQKALSLVENIGTVQYFGIVNGLKNVDFEGENALADRCNFSGRIHIGFRTTLGYNNFFHGDISIGKYCQIGVDVAIHTTNHPISYMSTYINSRLFDGQLKSLKQYGRVEIGNDVWVGHNALIIGNVKIGNGAVIAAGAVVTKDVPAYSIVAGVPAKVLRMRFCDNIINELNDLGWWDMDDQQLEGVKPLFFKDFTGKNSIYD